MCFATMTMANMVVLEHRLGNSGGLTADPSGKAEVSNSIVSYPRALGHVRNGIGRLIRCNFCTLSDIEALRYHEDSSRRKTEEITFAKMSEAVRNQSCGTA